MIPLVSKLLESDPRLATTPAMQRVRDLALSEGVAFAHREGHSQPAEHVRALWNARLENMHNKRRRFVGLPDLVRSVAALPPEEPVQQISLRQGLRTGLVFFLANSRQPLGAVVSTRTPADVKRSWDNYRMANGEVVEPARKRAAGSRREVKTSPAIAALQQ